MAEEQGNAHLNREAGSHLEHSAFPTDLPPLEVISRFWAELRRILPAEELWVIDPYVLDAGGEVSARYAENTVALLLPALRSGKRLVIIHGKSREGVKELIEQSVFAINPAVQLEFHHGQQLHSRYLIADRLRVVRMEFSFNRIGKSFGTVSLVEDEADLAGILGELERLDPHARDRR